MTRSSALLPLALTFACNSLPQDQASFQDEVVSAGLVAPDFGFAAYPGGKFMWSSQSAPDIENPDQAVGTRGTDRARNWVWDEKNLTMFPVTDADGFAVAFGSTLAVNNTYLFTFAADSAVVGNPKGWGVGTEDTEDESYVFYRADECGRPIYLICLHVDSEGNPGSDDCDGMYEAPDCSQYDGYYGYDTGN